MAAVLAPITSQVRLLFTSGRLANNNQVDHPRNTVCLGRQRLRAATALNSFCLPSQGDNTVLGGDINIQTGDIIVHQQLGFYACGGGSISDNLPERPVTTVAIGRGALDIRANLNAIVYIVDTVDVACDLFSQRLFGLLIDNASQGNCIPGYVDFQIKRIQLAVDGIDTP